jgi:hypothetical protein
VAQLSPVNGWRMSEVQTRAAVGENLAPLVSQENSFTAGAEYDLSGGRATY